MSIDNHNKEREERLKIEEDKFKEKQESPIIKDKIENNFMFKKYQGNITGFIQQKIHTTTTENKKDNKS